MRPYVINDYTIKILEQPEDIKSAQHLLFQTYVQEQSWNVPKNNPSGLKINTNNNNTKILNDNFDKYSTWVGSYHNNKLIACGRIVKRDENGLLEIERYPISNQLKAKICIDSMPNLIEINRSAIVPNYRKTVIWPCLLYFGFKYCSLHQLSTISTTSYDNVKQFHNAINYRRVKNAQFKYDYLDKTSVEVYLANIYNGEINIIINNLTRIIKQKLNTSDIPL